MSSFYKMDPSAWDFGTADLTLEQEAAYLRVVNAIHKHDAPVPNIDRVLAGLFRCSTRKARALVAALVDAEKLVIEDGKIWNERARSDLVHRQLASSSAAVRGSKGGRTRAERAAKLLENNEPDQANASSRIEENRIEEKQTKRDADKSAVVRGFPFDDFWSIWPNKVAKVSAEKAWKKLCRDDQAQALEKTASWFSAWRNQYPTASPIHPATYLNSKRWEDQRGGPVGRDMSNRDFLARVL